MIAPPRKAQVCATDTWCQPCVQLAAWHHCQLILSTFMVICPRGDSMSCRLYKYTKPIRQAYDWHRVFFIGSPRATKYGSRTLWSHCLCRLEMAKLPLEALGVKYEVLRSGSTVYSYSVGLGFRAPTCCSSWVDKVSAKPNSGNSATLIHW